MKKNDTRKQLDFYLKQSLIRAIRKNRNGFIWEKFVGCSLDELKLHIEKQFDENMSWDNYGSYWGIDFIIPKSLYKYNINSPELKKCWSLKNLRPLEINKCRHRKKEIDFNLVEKYSLYDILPIGILHLTKF